MARLPGRLVAVTSATPPTPGTLHLVQSPGSALRSCLALCVAGDGILLMDAGVMHLASEAAGERIGDELDLFCLAADLRARGLSIASSGPWQAVEDPVFAELLERYRHCVSWK